MNRDPRAKAPQKVNRRAKLDVDLSEVQEEIQTLTTAVSGNAAGIEALVVQGDANAEGIDSLGNRVDGVAGGVQQNTDGLTSLANTLTNNYLTTSELNTQLIASYVQRYELANLPVGNIAVSGNLTLGGENILDLIPDPTPPYVLPDDITVANLTTTTLTGTGFPEFATVAGGLFPSQNDWYQIGNPASRWVEGHFGSVYADNLQVTSGGTTRRVLLEGDVNTSVDYGDITNTPVIPSVPSWVLPNQNLVNLSGFNLDIDYTANVPVWVTDNQADVALSVFGGDIDASRVANLPEVDWGSLPNRPEWTNRFFIENIGSSMYPPAALNFDIAASDSLTPTLHRAYNLGQAGRAWLAAYVREVRAEGIRFHTEDVFQGGGTLFTGSYNELRDVPAPMVIPDLSILDELSHTPQSSGVPGVLSVTGNRVTGAAGPVGNTDLTNKAYVDTKVNTSVNGLAGEVFAEMTWQNLANKPSWLTDVTYINEGNRDLVLLNANLDVGQLRCIPSGTLSGSDVAISCGQSSFDTALNHRIISVKPGIGPYDAATVSQIPTRISQLTNDSGYLRPADVPTPTFPPRGRLYLGPGVPLNELPTTYAENPNVVIGASSYLRIPPTSCFNIDTAGPLTEWPANFTHIVGFYEVWPDHVANRPATFLYSGDMVSDGYTNLAVEGGRPFTVRLEVFPANAAGVSSDTGSGVVSAQVYLMSASL